MPLEPFQATVNQTEFLGWHCRASSYKSNHGEHSSVDPEVQSFVQFKLQTILPFLFFSVLKNTVKSGLILYCPEEEGVAGWVMLKETAYSLLKITDRVKHWPPVLLQMGCMVVMREDFLCQWTILCFLHFYFTSTAAAWGSTVTLASRGHIS